MGRGTTGLLVFDLLELRMCATCFMSFVKPRSETIICGSAATGLGGKKFTGIRIYCNPQLIDPSSDLPFVFSSSMMNQEASSLSWFHDVFISSIEEDTSKSFKDHLYGALVRAKIRTFKDGVIGPERLKAIKESRVAIIIFSVDYTCSTWYLDELTKILEYRKTIGQAVLPIFYDVDPSHVRRQIGSIAEAFAEYEESFKWETGKVQRWREALTEAANLSGWDLRNVAAGHYSKFINGIIEEVWSRLNQKQLNVPTYLVGMDSHVEKLNSLLSIGSSDIHIIGICGVGGIGKTTIAKAVYNLSFHRFAGSSFLENVREVSDQPNGLTHLQEQLLSDISMKKNIRINNVDRGIMLIEKRLQNKKVFIILDDVDQLNQINALVRKRVWFGAGSRIIITTRDEHLLNVLEVDEVYNVEELNATESLQLFSWHAFRKKQPAEGYVGISVEVVHNVGGIPLALKVLGSSLFGRSKQEWRTAIEKLKGIPHNEVQEKLRISFDALDDTEKDIFLDVACFFVDMNKDDVIRILEDCGFFAEIGINDLIHRSLIAITINNELWMHSVLKEMGRQIVREESIENPGKRSRLWFCQDAYDVLTKCMGTKAVEGLALELSKLEAVKFNIEAFAEMPKLRLLQVNYLHLLGDYKHLSKELRWLCWHGFPLKLIPTTFHMENLVVLDMQYSNIREFWKESKILKKLKVINLSHSLLLKGIRNFTRLPNLEKLILEDCISLVEVHQSIGNLHKLFLLNLQDCKNLKNLPVTICNLTSLENLTLSGCSKHKLPEELGNMGSLKELLADGTAINQLPFSIGRFRYLKSLSLGGFRGSPPKPWHSFFSSWSSSKGPDCINILPASFSLLQSLKCLILKGCNLSDGAMPNDFGTLSSLEELDLGYNNFCSLPANISRLSHLRKLRLRKCRMLQSLPELPSNLEILNVDGCTSLQSFPDLGSLSSLFELDLGYNNFISLPSSISGLSELVYLTLHHCTRLQTLPELPSSLRNLNLEGCRSMNRLSNLSNLEDLPSLMLRNCDKIVEIQDLEKMESVRSIHLEGCNNLSNAFKQSFLQELPKGGELNIFLPGAAIPEWFSHQSLGSSMSFEVPQLTDHKIGKLIICAIYAAVEEFHDEDYELADAPFLSVNNKTKSIKWRYCPTTRAIPVVPQDHMWVGCIPATEFGNLLGGGDEVEVSIEMEKLIEMKKCGVHLAIEPYEEYSESDDQSMIQYNSSLEDDFDRDVDVLMLDGRGAKRGRDEMGPSVSWPEEEEDPKCPTDEGQGGGGYSSYFKLFHRGFLNKLYGEGFTKTKKLKQVLS